MKQHKFLFLFFSLVLLVNPLLSVEPAVQQEGETEEQESPALPQKHSNPEAGYSIGFPSDWELMKEIQGVDVLAFAPAQDSKGALRESVNVVIAKLDGPVNQEQFYNLNIRGLQEQLTSFNLEASEDVTFKGVPAKKVTFTHAMGGIYAKVIQYLLLKGNNAYVITFTADPTEFESYKEVFENIGNSFAFEGDVQPQ